MPLAIAIIGMTVGWLVIGMGGTGLLLLLAPDWMHAGAWWVSGVLALAGLLAGGLVAVAWLRRGES